MPITSATPDKQNPIRVSGYRIDATGLCDRLFRWKRFGAWQAARKLDLSVTPKFIRIHITFDGRPSPVVIDLSNTFANAVRAVSIVEYVTALAPSLVLEPRAESLRADVSRYLTLTQATDEGSEHALRFAKADILLTLGDFKDARKAVNDFLNTGGTDGTSARLVRMQSYITEGDGTLAQVEYKRILEQDPSNQSAPIYWAIWQLGNDKDRAEELALQTMRGFSTAVRIKDLHFAYIQFLAYKRRYADAIRHIDSLLLHKADTDPNSVKILRELRAEVVRLDTDKPYNRRMTFWRPLFANTIGWGILGIVILAMLSPALFNAPILYKDLRDLHRLETDGIPSAGDEIRSNTVRSDFGFVQLHYVYVSRNAKFAKINGQLLPDNYGTITLRRSAAERILADTHSHSVVYLPEDSETSTIAPITREHYVGTIAKHALNYLFATIILLIVLYYAAKNAYRKIKYRDHER